MSCPDVTNVDSVLPHVTDRAMKIRVQAAQDIQLYYGSGTGLVSKML